MNAWGNVRREINWTDQNHRLSIEWLLKYDFSEDITHSSLKKSSKNPNPTYIDLEAGKLRSVSLNQDVKMLHSQ